MQEHEWLTSDNPAAMLWHLQYVRVGVGGRMREKPPITDRQLRLWVVACRAEFDRTRGKVMAGVPWDEPWDENITEIHVAAWASGSGQIIGNIRAALLREVVGNPFRPVCVSAVPPKIRSMAQAIDDRGQYEPWGMGALADELEESGCGEEELLRHLRGEERVIRWDPAECDVCCNRPDEEGCIEHGRGCYVVESDGGGYSHSEEVIDWIPLHQPHVKGCWAIELLRGEGDA